MHWNNGVLIYDGQTLDVVIRDLKRSYMDIIADDPGFWKTPGQPMAWIMNPRNNYSFNLY
jgi:hypothetical protein